MGISHLWIGILHEVAIFYMKTPVLLLLLLLCGMRPDSHPANGFPNPFMDNRHPMQQKIRIQVADRSFTATLQDGPASQAFLKLLPVRIDMHELNGNEKYGDLPKGLPVKAIVPDGIETGDIMLFGTKTLVLFYRSFQTTYGYTRIGKVDDPRRLEAALGEGDVEVSIE